MNSTTTQRINPKTGKVIIPRGPRKKVVVEDTITEEIATGFAVEDDDNELPDLNQRVEKVVEESDDEDSQDEESQEESQEESDEESDEEEDKEETPRDKNAELLKLLEQKAELNKKIQELMDDITNEKTVKKAPKVGTGKKRNVPSVKKSGVAKPRKEDGWRRPVDYGHRYLPNDTILVCEMKGQRVSVSFEKSEISHYHDIYHATFNEDNEERQFTTLNAVSRELAKMAQTHAPNAWLAFKTQDDQSILRLDIQPLVVRNK